MPETFHTFTLPPRFGGGDFVLRELSVGDFLDCDPKDRIATALYSYRGELVPAGAEREAFIRGLPGSVGYMLSKAVQQVHSPSEVMNEAFDVSHCVDAAGVHVWAAPELGELRMRELTFGEVEDVLSVARSTKSKQPVFALAAKASGRTEREIRDLPASVGGLVFAAYNQIHTTTDEEDAGFFVAERSATPPKAM